MIGIIGAMQVETEELLRQMADKTQVIIGGMPFVRGKLWRKDCVVATCGPGKVFAAIAAEIMILRYQPTYIVNIGVAGTLTDKLHIGDIAIATATVQYDMDTSALGDPVGMVSKINVTFFKCDPDLVEKCEKSAKTYGARYLTGVIATGDRFVGDKVQKTDIAEHFGAIACEMEGGAVGHTCYVNDTPYLVLRAISDEADGKAPDNFALFAKKSADKIVGILYRLIR